MPELVADCPRCGSRKITFDLAAAKIIAVHYSWQNWYETFCVCRHCGHATIFVLSESVNSDHDHVHKVGILSLKGSVNNYLGVEDFVSIKDEVTAVPPEHIPKDIRDVFKEGATCLAVGCYNAAGTMFRLCIDLATRSMLPIGEAEGSMQRFDAILGLGCHGYSRMAYFRERSRSCPHALKRMATTALMQAR